MPTIEELGRKLNDALHRNQGTLKGITDAIYDAARKEAGVTAYDLADETQEDSPRIRLYWAYVADMTTKVLLSAAQTQTHFKEMPNS